MAILSGPYQWDGTDDDEVGSVFALRRGRLKQATGDPKPSNWDGITFICITRADDGISSV